VNDVKRRSPFWATFIEGAGRFLASQRGIAKLSVKEVFAALALDCKTESTRNMGAPEEVAAMTDSFAAFFANSEFYPFTGGTNRHGIAHFYKTISAVDFLAFVSSCNANLSWPAPSPTTESLNLAAYFWALRTLRAAARPP
jgi:hypothetical protein